MPSPWFFPPRDNCLERRLAAIIARNQDNGVAYHWSNRCSQVRVHFDNFGHTPMPRSMFLDINIEGRRGTIAFLPSAMCDTIMVIYGNYGVIKAFSTGRVLVVSEWHEDCVPY